MISKAGTILPSMDGTSLLRYDCLKHHGQLDSNLTLLVRRKYIDDPVNGIGNQWYEAWKR